jgi:hypothetical protein
LDKDGTDLLSGSGTWLLSSDGSFIGLGRAGIFRDGKKLYLSMHDYDGSRRGASLLAIRPLTWDEQC